MNNPKETFLRKFNEAFARNDTAFILDRFTDDIEWDMIGDQKTKGKEAAKQLLQSMEKDREWGSVIHNIITHGRSAAVNGELSITENGQLKTYAFCDVYHFSGLKNLRISKLTSYVVDISGN